MKTVTIIATRLLLIGAASLNLMCNTPDEDRDPPGEGATPGGDSETTADAPCEDDHIECNNGDIQTCRDGALVPTSCKEQCSEIGLSSDGCDNSICDCGEPLDLACASGALAFCACAEWAEQPCSDELMFELYLECFRGTSDYTFVRCFESHVQGTQVDCQAAVEGCL